MSTALTPQHQAWIGMAETKNGLTASLQNKELAAQGLLNIPITDHAVIDAALASYRKAYTEMMELRKTFTNVVTERIIDPLMAFEKRVDPKTNAKYVELDQTSLKLRKDAAAKAQEQNAINNELASFKIHCENNFHRQATDYRNAMRQEVQKIYEYYLKAKINPDEKKIEEHLAAIKQPGMTKFIPTVISQPQMTEIYNGLHKPNWKEIQSEMLAEALKVFANFDSDVANAAAAIEHAQKQADLKKIEDEKKVQEEMSLTSLIVTSETVQVESAKVKVTYKIAEENSEQWAKMVMAGFITNLPSLAKHIRVSSWSKLTIGQMATYLAKHATETEQKVKGLIYESVER